MRSTWVRVASLAVLSAFAGGALVACGMSSESSSVLADRADTAFDDDASVGDSPVLAADASGGADSASPPTQTVVGSPLCGADKTTCFPDDDAPASTKARGGYSCVTASAGDAGDAGDAGAQTCRITSGKDTMQPSCASAGTGKQEAKCTVSADCAPGFDCVSTEGGSPGVCRRYCCAGSCDGTANAGIDAARTFCDLEPQQESQQFIPVCAPVRACEPLKQSSCAAGFTCAVGTGSGASCVAVGKAKEGDSCEHDHCGEGLACLGSWGSRKCFQLCRIGGTECAAGKSCKTSTALSYEGLGVCEAM